MKDKMVYRNQYKFEDWDYEYPPCKDFSVTFPHSESPREIKCEKHWKCRNYHADICVTKRS